MDSRNRLNSWIKHWWTESQTWHTYPLRQQNTAPNTKKEIKKTRKLKLNSNKNSLYLWRPRNSASFDIRIHCVGWTFRPFGSLPRTPFYRFSVKNSFSMKKMEKSSEQLPTLFSISQMCVNVHHNLVKNQDFFFWGGLRTPYEEGLY